MDAKPQRPVRAFAFQNENAPQNILQAKTIHSRHKSSPALTAFTKSNFQPKPTGGVSLAPRRAAFADLSNTRSVQSSKDDAYLPAKANGAIVKPVPTEDASKLAPPMQKAAQKPATSNTLRGFWNTVTGSSAAQTSNVNNKNSALAHVSENAMHPTQSRKALSKKNTMVFRESDPRPQSEGSHNEGIALPQDLSSYEAQSQVPNVTATTSSDIEARFNFNAPPGEAISHHYRPRTASTVIEQERNDQELASFLERANINANPAQEVAEIYQDARAYLQASQPINGVSVANIDPYLLGQENVQPDSDKYVAPLLADVQDEQVARYEDDYTEDQSLLTKGGYTTTMVTSIIEAPRIDTQAKKELLAAKATVDALKEVVELEEDEAWDPSMVSEYSEDIFLYMHMMEEKMRPNPLYMENQTEIQWSMRSILMDWLVQVHHRFQLLPETLFLCVNYIDRFLSSKVVSLGKLQLVGATAIFVAAKYEEINCPSVQEIVYMVDGGYSVDEILKAERFMLSMLQFELGWPGPMSFLRRVSKADDYDLETRTLAKYFLELTIMDERFVGCIPSFGAAGAHCLARLMLKKGEWSIRHVHYSGYTYGHLHPLISAMLSCCEDPVKHHAAIYEKYSDKRFRRASHYVQSELTKGFSLPKVKRPGMLEYSA